MARDWENENDPVEVCVYCGNRRPSQRYASCCGENHWEFRNAEDVYQPGKPDDSTRAGFNLDWGKK